MRCFIVQSPNLEEEEEDSTFNVQRETERDTEKERECTERDTETKTQRERESTGETGSLSRKCNLHQKLKVPVVLGWELHASPTKTLFYLWGKGSNIVQKYETQTDRQTVPTVPD